MDCTFRVRSDFRRVQHLFAGVGRRAFLRPTTRCGLKIVRLPERRRAGQDVGGCASH